MKKYIYVDNSNLWIEGRKVSAVHKGDAVDVWQATEQSLFDNNFPNWFRNQYIIMLPFHKKLFVLFAKKRLFFCFSVAQKTY